MYRVSYRSLNYGLLELPASRSPGVHVPIDTRTQHGYYIVTLRPIYILHWVPGPFGLCRAHACRVSGTESVLEVEERERKPSAGRRHVCAVCFPVVREL